jgi:hypothetical protein
MPWNNRHGRPEWGNFCGPNSGRYRPARPSEVAGALRRRFRRLFAEGVRDVGAIGLRWP